MQTTTTAGRAGISPETVKLAVILCAPLALTLLDGNARAGALFAIQFGFVSAIAMAIVGQLIGGAVAVRAAAQKRLPWDKAPMAAFMVGAKIGFALQIIPAAFALFVAWRMGSMPEASGIIDGWFALSTLAGSAVLAMASVLAVSGSTLLASALLRRIGRRGGAQ